MPVLPLGLSFCNCRKGVGSLLRFHAKNSRGGQRESEGMLQVLPSHCLPSNCMEMEPSHRHLRLDISPVKLPSPPPSYQGMTTLSFQLEPPPLSHPLSVSKSCSETDHLPPPPILYPRLSRPPLSLDGGNRLPWPGCFSFTRVTNRPALPRTAGVSKAPNFK